MSWTLHEGQMPGAWGHPLLRPLMARTDGGGVGSNVMEDLTEP